MADSFKVFSFIGENVDLATDDFIVPAVANLIDSISPVALACLTLYFVLMGYAVMTGAITEPFWKLVKDSFKYSFLVGVALSLDLYTEYVVDVLRGLESGLGEAFSVDGEAKNSYDALDSLSGRALDLVAICAQKSDEAGLNFGSSLAWWATGKLITIGTIFFALIAGGIVITAKFLLAILFAIGPFFLFFLMFPVTARFFDGWFSQVMNFTFIVVLVVVVSSFLVKVYGLYISKVDMETVTPDFLAAEVIAITGIMCFLVYQVSKIAAALAGGLAMEAMTLRQMAMPITAPASGTRALNNALNPVSTKPDMQTGRLESHSRLGHLIRGNTKLSPAYRQYVGKTWGRNWGTAKGGKVDKNS